MPEQPSNNTGAWIGFAGAIIAALIGVAAMAYFRPEASSSDENVTIEPPENFELVVVLGTAAIESAGTDSDIAIKVDSGDGHELPFVFDGNDGFSAGRLTDSDNALEEGRSNTNQTFPLEGDLEITSLELVLVHPEMAKSNWIGENIRIDVLGDGKTIRSYCAYGFGEINRTTPAKGVAVTDC